MEEATACLFLTEPSRAEYTGGQISAECFRNGLPCTARYWKGIDQAATFVFGDQNLSFQGKVCLRDTRFTHAQIHPHALGALSEYGSCLRAIVIPDAGSNEAHKGVGGSPAGIIVERHKVEACCDI